MIGDLPPEAFDLPLDAFIARLATHVLEEYIPSDIETEGSAGSGDGSNSFYVARALKGHPDLRHAGADQAADALMSNERMAAVLSDMPSMRIEFTEDDLVAFYAAWERVRVPMNVDPVEAAMDVVSSLPPELLLHTVKRRPGRYPKFLTLAALLQLLVAQGPILLPCRKVGHHMGCELNTVSTWANWGRDDGVLLLAREHSFRSGAGSRASEYVMGLHQWEGRVIRGIAEAAGIRLKPELIDWTRAQFELRVET